MTVRLAAAADTALVEAVVRAAYTPWVAVVGGRPAPLDADYAELIAAGSVHVTDDVDGVLVLAVEEDALVVENVAVRPDRQGRGIGRQLLAFAESKAAELGLPAVRLYAHERMTSNVELYERLGYTRTGLQAVEFGHLVHLRKQLTG
jgi:ribosomal protein S18 acetylase RimI-like enzyme